MLLMVNSHNTQDQSHFHHHSLVLFGLHHVYCLYSGVFTIYCFFEVMCHLDVNFFFFILFQLIFISPIPAYYTFP